MYINIVTDVVYKSSTLPEALARKNLTFEVLNQVVPRLFDRQIRHHQVFFVLVVARIHFSSLLIAMGVDVLGRIGMQYRMEDCFCIQGIVWVKIQDWRLETLLESYMV